MRPFAAFALGALVVFASVGVALYTVVQNDVRQYEESSAQMHAEFVAKAILPYVLQPQDLTAPPGDQRQYELTALVKQRVLVDPTVRVKIWASDGTVLFSDDPRLPGMHFHNPEVSEAFKGRTVSEVVETSRPENYYERTLSPKLFSTYIPISLDGTISTQPQAVVEIYQRYDRIQAGIDQLSRDLTWTLGIGLAVLYLLLLPLVVTTRGVHADRARAQRLNEEKSRFLAFMGHELRTPLNSILGFTELLEVGSLNPRQARYVGNIRTSGRQLLDVINELLDFSRAEAGQLRVARDRVNATSVVETVLEQLRPMADVGDVTLVDAADKALVIADPLRLQQVLTNLVNNAVKFTPAEGKVCVDTRSRDGWVEIRISDNGIGIPAGELDRIFEPFTRVENGGERREGSGLGLSLSRKLIEAMGGTLDVESSPGQGSTFTLKLKQA
jgi:signal transduction histidine kinase